MKQLLVLLAFYIPLSSQSQVATWPAIVGLQFSNQTLTPAQVIPSSGQLITLASQPTSQDHFLSGNSAIDPVGQRYFYVAGDNPEFITVDLTTGTVQQSFNLPRGGNINQPLGAMTYHAGQQLVYGLQLTNQGLYLVSINPQTGAYQVISPQPIAANEFTGEGVLDTVNGLYYVISGYRGTTLSRVDIQTGQATYVSLPTVGGTTDLIHRMVNIVYSHTDSVIYGLQFRKGSLTFCSMDPATGQFNFPGTGPTSADMFQAGNAVLDDDAGVYYYTRSPFGLTEMIALDVYTGQVLSAPLVQPLVNHSQFVNLEFNPAQQPIARFFMEKDCANLTVHFHNQSIGKQFVWHFGDGTTSTDIHPVHTYPHQGPFQVQLIAHGDSLSHQIAHSMDFWSLPKPTIQGVSELPVGQRTTLQVAQPADSYMWSTGKTTPTISIERGGTYEVSVTVDGCIGVDTHTVSTLKPYEVSNQISQVFSFADTFSGSIQFRNITPNPIELMYRVSRKVPLGWEAILSATGDIQLTTKQLVYNYVHVPPYGEGAITVDWIATYEYNGELTMVLEHPFGGTLETLTFQGIAKKVTGLPKAQTLDMKLQPMPVACGGQMRLSVPIPKAGAILDMTGRLVATLSQGQMLITAPSVSGLYWLRLDDGTALPFVVQ